MMNWKPLPLSPTVGNQLPSLLIASSFTKDTYNIHFTDLTNIWSENLDHTAILRRSRDENTSIDPTDDDQRAILLEKLQHGLAGEASDATLALTIHASENARPALTLNITVDLPGGLAPLQWPVQLAAASQTLFTSQLVLPLLRAQYARRREIASLKEALAEKDHVIQKVVDKLEAQGTDLAEVFPQAAAVKGRKADRKRAEGRVKGLGVFEEDVWRKNLDGVEEQDMGQLIQKIFGDAGREALISEVPHFVDAEDEESWWEGIKGITINLKTGKFSTRSPTKTSRKPPPPPVKPSIPKDDTEDSAFQVQATPPHKASTPPKQSVLPPTSIQDDDTTDDDEDLDAPSQVSNIPDSFNSQAALRARSPKLVEKSNASGGKKSTPETTTPKKATRLVPPSPNDETDSDATEDESPQPPPSQKHTPAKCTKSPSPPPSPPPKRDKLGKIGTRAKEREKTPPRKEPTPDLLPKEPVKARTPTPKKAKLGKIGGKRKELTPVPEPGPEVEVEAEAATQTTPGKRKLGVIGRHVRKSTPAASQLDHDTSAVKSGAEISGGRDGGADGDEGRGRAVEKEETPPPRETSEERADRKREELRKELEKKARAAPVRKKRKF